MSNQFDVVVVGGGPGGYVCAIRCAQLGLKVACVEKEKTLGGTCLNVGCIPSKAMLESSHHYSSVLNGYSDHGIECSKVKLNLKTMIGRKNKVVEGITSGVDFLFKKNKIKRFLGHGKLTGPNSVSILPSGETIKAKHIVLATGSEPIELPFAKFDHKTIINSTDALDLTSVPKELVVIGGGVIGLELGSVWSRLGAKVSVIEASDSILGTMDKTVTNGLMKTLKKQGMEFYLSTKLKSIEVKAGKAKVHCDKGGDELILNAEKVLVAVGRKPYTDNLGLESCGVMYTDRGRVKIDGQYRTSVNHIYAIGDVVDGPMLAHKAEEEGQALAEMIAGQKGHVNYRAIPGVVYTWPEVASVGLSESECKEKGIGIKVGKFNFKANGRAKAMGDDDGLVKIIADAKTDKIIGAHILGANASELIAEIVIGFEYSATSEDLARSVHAHPTLAEAIKEACLDVEKRAIHS